MASAPPLPDNSTPEPTPPSLEHKTRAGLSLDPASYPHIWDLIIQDIDEDSPEYLALRDTCTALRDIISSRLYGSVAVWEHYEDDRWHRWHTPAQLRFASLDNECEIPGLDWNVGDLQRQLCVQRLKKYCKIFANVISERRMEANDAEVALLGTALTSVETLCVANPNRPLFSYPHVTTIVGCTGVLYASKDFSGGDRRWEIDSEEDEPENREELAPHILNPQLVPPSTKTIVYSINIRDAARDHGNNNLVVNTDLSALKHLTDVAFAFNFWESMFDHRPNTFKPLGVLNTLVRSVANAVPRVRLTFKGLEGYQDGWFCGPGIPEDDHDAWTQYMRRYIAQYILWVQTDPGMPGESYFKWAARMRNTDEGSTSLATALEPILGAVYLETADDHTLCGSEELYNIACVGPEKDPDQLDGFNPQFEVTDDTNQRDYFEILHNHGDDDYDGFYLGGRDMHGKRY